MSHNMFHYQALGQERQGRLCPTPQRSRIRTEDRLASGRYATIHDGLELAWSGRPAGQAGEDIMRA
jgi:hypothetical protein